MYHVCIDIVAYRVRFARFSTGSAWEVLEFMGLEPVADAVYSEEEYRHSARQLTEVQVKCLQVAVLLLNRPAAIFLDKVGTLSVSATHSSFRYFLNVYCSILYYS